MIADAIHYPNKQKHKKLKFKNEIINFQFMTSSVWLDPKNKKWKVQYIFWRLKTLLHFFEKNDYNDLYLEVSIEKYV